ncbi:hypothetical protein JCM33374_g5129, partial [Metschnikowia sp. JCM 33374]
MRAEMFDLESEYTIYGNAWDVFHLVSFGTLQYQSHGAISPMITCDCNGDAKYVHDIYLKNMPKADYYGRFKFHGEVNMFSELDNAKHLQFKKMINGLYSKSAIYNPKNITRNIVVEKVRELVKQVYLSSVSGQQPDYRSAESKLNPYGKGSRVGSGSWYRPSEKGTGIGIDVLSLFTSFAMDVVTAFELGPQNGTNVLQERDQSSIFEPFRMVGAMVAWSTQLPSLWYWAAGPEVRAAAQEIEDWQLGLYEVAEKNVPEKSPHQNLTTLEAFKANGVLGPRAYSNISDNILAGHDATSLHFTYLCYELSRPSHSDWQVKVRDEIRAEFGSPSTLEECIDDFERVDKLSYVEAVVQESLRVHAFGFMDRRTSTNYDVDINGKKVTLPPGTGISCQVHLMHRVEKIFPQPNTWNPQRWLQNKEESAEEYAGRLKEMQRYMLPFGKGQRMCIGYQLGVVEIKMALSNLYWRYKSALCSDWCDITPAEKGGDVQIVDEFAPGTTDEIM